MDAEDATQPVAGLAERDSDLDRGDEKRQEILAAARRPLERIEGPPGGVTIPRGARARTTRSASAGPTAASTWKRFPCGSSSVPNSLTPTTIRACSSTSRW